MELARAQREIERLSEARQAAEGEAARLRLRAEELQTALRERHEAFLDMLDRLQRREEEEVRRTLRELWRSEERFRLLVESIQDYAIFMLDPEGHVVSWNTGAQRIHRYTREEVLGKHVSLFYPADELDGGQVAHELESARRMGRHESEGWRLRKDGGRFWADAILTALRDEDGEMVGFAKITRDLTERMHQQRALEETAEELETTVDELRERTDEAEAANRAKSDFLAVMSHELRTPLNAIMGYTDLLESQITGPLSQTQVEQLRRIQRSSAHLLQLIDEILTYARTEAGKEEVRLEATDVAAVSRGVAEQIEPLASAKGLALRVDLPAEPLMAETDPKKLRQILLNLLGNAVKFTDAGEVALRVDRKGDRAVVRVSDTGIGIPPEYIGRIFEPFWQVEQSKTRRAEGTGLGLSVTRRLVLLLGGEIRVESRPGAGSTFVVEFPVSRR